MSLAGRMALSLVAELGNDAILCTLVQDDPGKINLAGIDGRTPLSYAAGNGHTLTVDHVLENSGFADAADIKKRTPLSWTAASGHISTSLLLLINSADQDVEGKPPLIYACINGHAELVAQLLEWNDTSPVLKDYNFSSPLLYNASHGHDAIIEMLPVREEVGKTGPCKDGKRKLWRRQCNPGWNVYFDIHGI